MGSLGVVNRMLTTVRTILELIRQPEYTAENRCYPCTIVNVLIAAIMASVLAMFLNPVTGGIALATFISAIYLRGYLVPGTPTLTKRYLPTRVHRLFGTHINETDDDRPKDSGGDIESLLRTTGVVVNCPTEVDLCLEPSFRAAWRDRIAAMGDVDTQLKILARRLRLERSALALEESMGGYVARYEGDRIGMWPSEAAFLADLAAAPTLDEYGTGWDELTGEEQGSVLTGLRVFLESCPTCGGSIDGNEETVESCCTTATKIAVECGACGATLLQRTA